MNTWAGQIRLDFRSQEPIYLQIVRQVEQLVQDGALKPGDQLPTVRQTAIDLRINYSTVARAYNVLDERRLISTQRGRGTYIWEDEHRNDQAAEIQESSTGDIDRERLAHRLAREYIEEAIRCGLNPNEIKQAFDREVTGRISIQEVLKKE